MECLRCGAKLNDKAVVCNKCGFIVKGSRKIEDAAPQMSLEERIAIASEDELRAMLVAMNEQRLAAIEYAKKKDEIDPEIVAAVSGKRWSTVSLLCGLLSLVLIVIPGINVIAALILFVLAFMGFGKSNGQKTDMAMIGLIMTIVAIAGSWAYNVYFAGTVSEMLGLAPVVEETGEVIETAAS